MFIFIFFPFILYEWKKNVYKMLIIEITNNLLIVSLDSFPEDLAEKRESEYIFVNIAKKYIKNFYGSDMVESKDV